MPLNASQRYAPWLWLLLGLFVVRVVAQPLALVVQARLLPPFEAWHSGVVPYPWLVASQLAIVGWFAWTAWTFTTGHVTPRPRVGHALLALGGVYFGAMLVRLLLGATLLGDRRWFASPVPTVFHLVLAAYLLVCGRFHVRHGLDRRVAETGAMGEPPLNTLLPWLPYPLVMTFAFGTFSWMHAHGASLLLSTYVPVLLTAAIVTILELVLPHRREWRPPSREVRTDLVFMTVVQLAWPPMVSLLFTFALVAPARALQLPFVKWWPHEWPIWLQAILMVLAVDFFRYWLHRAAHESRTLWRLHAVHHSVEQLYWLNTARFHPIEKALQMSLDSLPFVLMGVDPRVLSLYYLAYATNGFFQHCNIRLRYGVLNFIVGSAETHRWHHSRVVQESNANYGNTVIIWDLLFGTWYLPKAREVESLGLLDPEFPKSFWTMMGAPFRR